MQGWRAGTKSKSRDRWPQEGSEIVCGACVRPHAVRQPHARVSELSAFDRLTRQPLCAIFVCMHFARTLIWALLSIPRLPLYLPYLIVNGILMTDGGLIN